MGAGDETSSTQQPLLGGAVPVTQQEFAVAVEVAQPDMPGQSQVYYAQGPPAPGGSPTTGGDKVREHSTKHHLMEKRAELQIGQSVKDGWRLYKQHWGWYTGVSAVSILFCAVIYHGLHALGHHNHHLRGLWWFANLVFFPLWFGPFMAASHELRSSGLGWSSRDLFSGYLYYLPALGFGLMINTAIFLGLMLFVVPGIYLAFVLPFAPYVFFEYHGEVGFFDALDISRRVCHRQFCNLVGLWIVSILVALLGFLCLGVGLFVAVPVIALAWTAAFDQIFGMNPRKHKDFLCVGCC